MAARIAAGAPTNNRAEYLAALAAICTANDHDPDRQCELIINSDANLLVTSMTEQVHVWSANGWRTAKGQPVKNRDLLEAIMHHGRGRTLQWRHVPRAQNSAADRLAKRAAAGEHVGRVPPGCAALAGNGIPLQSHTQILKKGRITTAY